MVDRSSGERSLPGGAARRHAARTPGASSSRKRADRVLTSRMHQALPHDSAHKHVTGEALYVDDLPEPAGTAHLYLGLSDRAHAKIISLDLDAVRASPGVLAVLTSADIPG